MIKNLCVSCDRVISAPDEMRGEDFVCTHCGAHNLLLSAEDIADQLEEERTTQIMIPVNEPIMMAPEIKENRAVNRLKDLSDFLLLFAYIQCILLIAGGAAPFIVKSWPFEWQLLSLISAGVAASLLFVTFKFLSELVQSLAEQSARQSAMEEQLREILMLLRERDDI